MLRLIRFLRALTVWLGMIAVLSVYPASAAEQHETPISLKNIIYEKYVSENNSFVVLIPKGWGKKENNFSHAYTQTGDKLYGVEIYPTQIFADAAPAISILYYEYGEFFTHYQRYITLKAGSFTRLAPEKPVPVMDIVVAGKAAKQFEIETFERIPLPFNQPDFKPGIMYRLAPPSKEITLKEKYIVIPTAKGFYVLSYRASLAIANSIEEIFGKIKSSFEPAIQ